MKEASLEKTELESAELAGEELDNVGGFGRWDEEAVDSMDDAVCAELVLSVIDSLEEIGRRTILIAMIRL